MSLFDNDIIKQADTVLRMARKAKLSIATAESCTGGLIIGCLTEIPGSSDVVQAGLVTYSNHAKTTLLNVSPALIDHHGAVSKEVALAMTEGALNQTTADLVIAVTGIAGPGGGSADKPVGLVHFAAQRRGHPPQHKAEIFSDQSRMDVRLETVRASLMMLTSLIDHTDVSP
ncbi:MAG: damage-inducible protein CinA [Kordiimonas sp.]|nr:damage-inducible protein CinA [Kordiimonas sp.]|tara:strand:+ start:308 stop:823 length:516 start_codon:yes stop_codon:yes gene_type:complete